MKMWSGRFEKETDRLTDDFNSSLSFDCRLYRHDIQGSIAHATMLGECGILEKSESEAICGALNVILTDIESGALTFERGGEDIHMFIEDELTRRIGMVGKKLHTARSRNDQVALDLRLYLRSSIDNINSLLSKLIKTILEIAENNLETIIPAYTHIQKAQPSTLAHHYSAYAEMLLRDVQRLTDCRKRVNILPLGACALCGTTYPIDRELTARLLGFDDVTQNSMDSVSDRDFAVEFLSCCAIIMMHLSRFNEEIIYWASDEFGYIALDDRFSTGSSIMPQKKNPDISELIRGKTGRCYGDLISLLTVMKGLPLAYNKDMQEDKESVFDADDTVVCVLKVFTAMLPTLKYNKEKLRASAGGGFSAATDCADYLVRKGLPFRDAHGVSGRIVRYAIENNTTLDRMSLNEYLSFSPLFDGDILSVVQIENVVQNRNVIGGPSKNAVQKSISGLKKRLAKVLKA